MAKKQRKGKLKLPSLEEIKKKIKAKVYIGDEMKKRELRIKELEKQVDSLQTENDSLKQVIKVRVK